MVKDVTLAYSFFRLPDFSFWISPIPESSSLQQGKSPIFFLELSQKSDFQPLNIKPDNICHLTVETGQIWPWGGFEGGLYFSKGNKKSN